MGSFIIFFCNPIIVLLEQRKKINGSLRNKYLQTFWKCILSRKGNIPLSTLIIWEFTTQDQVECAVQPHNRLQIKSTNSRFQTYKWNSKSPSSFYIITKGILIAYSEMDYLLYGTSTSTFIGLLLGKPHHLTLEKKRTGVKMQKTSMVNSSPQFHMITAHINH